MRDLILIESIFNVLAVASKISIAYYGVYESNQVINGLFLGFFGLQTYGFISNEKKYTYLFSSIRSWTLFAQICLQRFHLRHLAESGLTANVLDKDGRLLIWGEDAPANVMLHYGFWLLGVLYVDYEDFLPNSAIQATHLGSFLLACFSGEFWVCLDILTEIIWKSFENQN